MKIDYVALMSTAPSVLLTTPTDLKTGTVIGFKGLGDERGITAAYPVYKVRGNEIVFVLFISSDNGRPCLDNTWFDSDKVYVNNPPIMVDEIFENPYTFQDGIISMFTFPKPNP